MRYPLLPARLPVWLALASLLFLGLGTGCSYHVFHAEAGSGYRIGLTVSPPVIRLISSLLALLAYVGWRRRSNR